MIRFRLLAWLFAAFWPSLAFSQTEDFSRDLAFFQQNTQHYQHWLDATGLGKALKVETIQLKKGNTELEMLLLLRTHDADTAVGLWKSLQTGFRAQRTDSLRLEEALFETFVRKMQIPAAQGNIQIYIRDARQEYIPCFYVWVWDEKGTLAVKERLQECRAKEFEVELKPVQVRKVGQGRSSESRRDVPPNRVFDEILRFAREQYEKTTCYDRYPKVEVDYQKTKGNTLEFSATDLCRVVLTNEKKSAWCALVTAMGLQCNDIKRERLVFTIHYIPTDTGYRLHCRLQGLFGSGFYQPRRSGYMDMEPDFNDYLDSYVNDFQFKLKQRLDKL